MIHWNLLKTRRFLPFFITQFLGALNDNIFKLSVLTLIAFHLAQNVQQNQSYQALGLGLFTLPFLLFSASAGQLADRLNKVAIMRWIKSIEIFLMLLGALSLWLENITLMFTVIFLMGLHSTCFGPVKYAIIPESLNKAEWPTGNALLEAATFIAILIGTIAGTVLIPNTLTAFDLRYVCMSIVCVAFLGTLSAFYVPQTSHKNHHVAVDWHILRATIQVLKSSTTQPGVFMSIFGISWFWFIGATILTELPVYVQHVLQAPKEVFTFFLVLFSIGIAIGSLISGHLNAFAQRHSWIFMVLLSLFMGDVMLANPRFSTSLLFWLKSGSGFRLCIDFLSIAICGGIYVVPLYTALQKQSPSDSLSRMVAANNIMNSLLMVSSALWIMLLNAFHISVEGIFLSVALLNLSYVGFVLKQSLRLWKN